MGPTKGYGQPVFSPIMNCKTELIYSAKVIGLFPVINRKAVKEESRYSGVCDGIISRLVAVKLGALLVFLLIFALFFLFRHFGGL